MESTEKTAGTSGPTADSADDWWGMTSEQQPTTGVTREIALLWGTRETAKRGPKPKLSRAAIVDTAVEVADAEGLDAVSMQRVAKELGYTTMSLYRHVDSKEDLVTLMLDAALSEYPSGPRVDGDWRSGVEEWSRKLVAQYRKHPWATYVPQAGPPSGPNGLRWMEAGLRELTASGLTPAEAVQILLLFSYTLRDVVRMEHDMALVVQRSGIPRQDTEEGWVSSLRQVLDPKEFPTITRSLEQGTFEEDPPESVGDTSLAGSLNFPIQRVLDGVEAYVGKRRQGREDTPGPEDCADGGDAPGPEGRENASGAEGLEG